MTYVAKPRARHPLLPLNELGLTRRDYEGAVSTLCAGCGHDSVSAAIVQACAELALPPHKFAKVSGIGCSSKTPSYFLSHSHGFNAVHGRMPSVATGANLANRELYCIGVSATATAPPSASASSRTSSGGASTCSTSSTTTAPTD